MYLSLKILPLPTTPSLMDAPLCSNRTLVTNAICLYLPPKILYYPLTPLPPANGYNLPFYSSYRSLVINGCHGNWPLCGLYSLC